MSLQFNQQLLENRPAKQATIKVICFIKKTKR